MKYQNPIIRGFNPDPSICRVGEDYYLVTSSFEYFPGLPIYHSKDLVNWEQIGNCLQRAEEFPLNHVKDSGGVWAPTIRYQEGVFYVTATLEQYGNFIVSAHDPKGVWSAPVWVKVGGIDPSLLFENEKVYYCTNYSLHPWKDGCKGQEEITLEEIDLHTGELLTEPKTIWSGIGGGFLEAPHIYHIGEWYYLMVAEGGTNYNHMVTISRSKSIWGPYENCPYNPILTNVHDTSKEVQCSGHGDLFEDHNGNWWMVHLAIRLCRRTMTNLGRETFLTPIMWKDGWPVVAEKTEVPANKMAVLNSEGPLWIEQREKGLWEINLSSQAWEPEILHLRTPVWDNYQRKDDCLLIKPSTVKITDQLNPSVVLLRQKDFECTMNTEFTFDAFSDGDEAGIVVMLTAMFHYKLFVRRQNGKTHLILEKNADDICYQVFSRQLDISAGDVLKMKVCADKEAYTFYFGVNGEAVENVGSGSTRFLCVECAGRSFTGTVMGLYTCCDQLTDSEMCIKKFQMF